MGLDDVTLDNLAGTDTAVVVTLRSRETSGRPAVRAVVEVEEGILLLKTEPGHVLGKGLHDLHAVMSVVVLVGGAIGVPALGEDDDVGGATEGIGEDGGRSEVDIGVVTGGLESGGTIKVPDGKVFRLVVLRLKSSGL